MNKLNIYKSLPRMLKSGKEEAISLLESVSSDDQFINEFASILLRNIENGSLSVNDYSHLKSLICKLDGPFVEASKEVLLKSYSDNITTRISDFSEILKLTNISVDPNSPNNFAILTVELQSKIKKLISTALISFIGENMNDTDILLDMFKSVKENDEFGIVELIRELFKENYANILGNCYYEKFYNVIYAGIPDICHEILKTKLKYARRRNSSENMRKNGHIFNYYKELNEKKRKYFNR